MIGTWRGRGFTLLELLVVIGIVGIIAGVGTPLYINWRASALNGEAVAAVQQAIAASREEAKRTATDVTMTFADGQTSILRGAQTVTLPNGGRLGVVDPLHPDVAFEAPLGVQTPFSEVELTVTTGNGALQRSAQLTIIPPLGKTVVAR